MRDKANHPRKTIRRKLIGLNRYIYSFPSKEEQKAFLNRNEHRAEIQEVFINNGYALEVRFLRRIY